MSELLNFVLSQGDQFRRARLPSLYSDFNLQRHANPDGFAANTAAWIAVLSRAAQAGLLHAHGDGRDTLSLRTGEDLLRDLETKEWGRPLALGTVIDGAVSQRQMMPYQEFFAVRKCIYSRNWTVQPWWLFSWGLKQLGLFDQSTAADKLPAGRFVLVHNVEDAANKILKQMAHQSNQIDRIYPVSHFSTEAAKIMSIEANLSDSDLQIILKFLARDRSAIFYDSQTVKFKGRDETSTSLTDQDRTIASLKSLIADLEGQVALLSGRISNLVGSAQRAVKDKNRVSALAALRSKKSIETALAQRSETLSQLEEVYSKIEEAADQVAIVRVMKDSTAVLRNLHAEVGSVERVEDVVAGLRDEMDKVDEIGNAVEASGQEHNIIDEDAVDDELESLERQAKMEQEEREAREMQEKLASLEGIRRSKEIREWGPKEIKSLPSEVSNKAQDTLVEERVDAMKRLSLEQERAPTGTAHEKRAELEEQMSNAPSGG